MTNTIYSTGAESWVESCIKPYGGGPDPWLWEPAPKIFPSEETFNEFFSQNDN